MIKNAKTKLEDVGGITFSSVRNGDLTSLNDAILNTNSGIFLANENSMIDTQRIDYAYNGKVSREAVNLDTKQGNTSVLETIALMQSKPNATFFAGTLLRNFGEYSLPVMPIVQDKMIEEKIKQTGVAYVDDYVSLARELLGEKYAEKVRNSGRGVLFEEPMKSLIDALNKEVELKRKNNVKEIKVNGLYVLPVICNEISTIGNLYKGKELDMIVHSCENLYSCEGERFDSYKKILKQMDKKGKIKTPTIIAYNEGGDNPKTGLVFYDGRSIKNLN